MNAQWRRQRQPGREQRYFNNRPVPQKNVQSVATTSLGKFIGSFRPPEP